MPRQLGSFRSGELGEDERHVSGNHFQVIRESGIRGYPAGWDGGRCGQHLSANSGERQ